MKVLSKKCIFGAYPILSLGEVRGCQSSLKFAVRMQ